MLCLYVRAVCAELDTSLLANTIRIGHFLVEYSLIHTLSPIRGLTHTHTHLTAPLQTHSHRVGGVSRLFYTAAVT